MNEPDLKRDDVVKVDDGRYIIAREVRGRVFGVCHSLPFERVRRVYRMNDEAALLLSSSAARQLASDNLPGWRVSCFGAPGRLELAEILPEVQPGSRTMQQLFDLGHLLPEAAVLHLEALPKTSDPYAFHREQLGLSEEQIAAATREHYET